MLDYYVEQAIKRHQELLHEAEERARVHRLLAEAPHQPGLGDRTLAMVGRRLVGLGERLQARTGFEGASPAIRLAGAHSSTVAFLPDCLPSEVLTESRSANGLGWSRN